MPDPRLPYTCTPASPAPPVSSGYGSKLSDLIKFTTAKFTPRSLQPAHKWVEENANIAPGTSGTGPVTYHRHPFARTPVDCFGAVPPPIYDIDGNDLSADPRYSGYVHDITLEWCTQSSKTTVINCGVLYRVVQHPANIVWAFPNEDLVRGYNVRRLEPFIRANPVIYSHMPRKARAQAIRGDDYFNDPKFTIAEKIFSGCWIKFAHSGSPTALSSDPAEIVIVDEQDKAKRETETEAASYKLADERTHAYKATAKRVKASTPSDEASPIHQDFLKGTQERFYVESPHAPGKYFWLRWKDENGNYCLSWDRQLARKPDGSWDKHIVAATAHYTCPFTGFPIYDDQKLRMIQTGQWRVTNPNPAPGHRSFHLNCFYSPNHTFGDIALKWIEALENADDLRNFVNSWLAEPWIPHREENVDLPTAPYVLPNFSITDPSRYLGDAPGRFHIREKPGPGEVDLTTFDKQKFGYYGVTRRCGKVGSDRPGASRLVYEGTPEALVSDAALHTLTAALGVDPTPTNNKIGTRVAIDHGYKGTLVAQLAVQRGWIMLKGDSTKYDYIHTDPDTKKKERLPWAPVQYVNPNEGLGPHKGPKVRLYIWSTPSNYTKLDRLRRRSGSEWLVPEFISDEYRRHMRAWSMLPVRTGRVGIEIFEWQNPSEKPDHFWDCEAMMMVLMSLHKIPYRIIHANYLPAPNPDSAPAG